MASVTILGFMKRMIVCGLLTMQHDRDLRHIRLPCLIFKCMTHVSVGPVTGLGYIPYLLQTIDYSTADEQFLSALSEDERVIPLKKVETREVYLLK